MLQRFIYTYPEAANLVHETRLLCLRVYAILRDRIAANNISSVLGLDLIIVNTVVRTTKCGHNYLRTIDNLVLACFGFVDGLSSALYFAIALSDLRTVSQLLVGMLGNSRVGPGNTSLKDLEIFELISE